MVLGLMLAGISHAAWLYAPDAGAAAPAFPIRPVRFVVPFPPGTSTDVVVRLLSLRLADSLGQQIVIDNRAGASGAIGVEIVARATPNGYTWVLGTTSTHALAPTLNPALGYQPVKDFAPIALLGESPYFVTTHPGIPATNVQEFVGYARANPGKVHYASVGNASLGHLAGELLKKAAGFDMMHVPYKGSTLAIVDLLAGRIQLQITTVPASLPHVRAGKLRALAVTSRERLSAAPQVRTVAESGLPGYHAALWMAVFAPAQTPAAVTALIHGRIAAIMAVPQLREALIEQGFASRPQGPEDVAKRVREDTARWRKVILDAGIRAD
ncbi:MAG: tripartite tricarboxylate transporter substrate binding protein [Betaproteobacteria bacterium]